MNDKKHHLVLGELKDYLTGQTLEDSHDERFRQKLARFLAEEKGFTKADIIPRRPVIVTAGQKKAVLKVDLSVVLSGKTAMIIKYGPGSLVTRRRPALGFSRILESYQIPEVVVTNGEDAEILSGETGRTVGEGLQAIPSKTKLSAKLEYYSFAPVSAGRRDLEARIVYAYEDRKSVV